MKSSIQELKELLIFGFLLQDTITGFVRTEKPRWRKWLSAFKFAPLIPTIQPAFEGLGNPLDHWRKLSPDERQELCEWAKEEFDIDNDALEEVIEDSIGVAAANIEIGKRWIEVTRRNK